MLKRILIAIIIATLSSSNITFAFQGDLYSLRPRPAIDRSAVPAQKFQVLLAAEQKMMDITQGTEKALSWRQPRRLRDIWPRWFKAIFETDIELGAQGISIPKFLPFTRSEQDDIDSWGTLSEDKYDTKLAETICVFFRDRSRNVCWAIHSKLIALIRDVYRYDILPQVMLETAI